MEVENAVVELTNVLNEQKPLNLNAVLNVARVKQRSVVKDNYIKLILINNYWIS